MRNRDFWNCLPQCSKIDVLDRPQHVSMIAACLGDPLTSVERLDKDTYSVYGPEEAILVRPTALTVSFGMLFLSQLALLSHN